MPAVSLLMLCDLVGSAGGVETSLARIVPRLIDAGVDVRILARSITDADHFGAPAREIAWAGENETPSAAAAREVADMIERTQPDVVLTSNVFDAEVLRAARSAKRFVVRISDHRAFCPNGDRLYPQFPGSCAQPMGRACLANAIVHGCVQGPRPQTLRRVRSRERVRDAMQVADALIVSSAYMARLAEINGISPERIALLLPPVAPEGYAQAIAPAPPSRRVLFAGRIVPSKGLNSLVGALGMLPKDERPELRVAGAPSAELSSAIEHARRVGVSVIHLGWLDETGLREAIDDVHAIVVPSLWPEPFGLIGVEAQARGRPAVAYATGGITEWIGDAGITVPVRDREGLARGIAIVTAPERWSAFSKAAVASAASFRLDTHVERLKEVLLAY